MIRLTNCPICESSELVKYMDVKDHMITKEEFVIEQCKSCGFHFTNPRPTITTIGNYYKSENYVSHSSSRKGIINNIYNVVRNYTLRKKVQLLRNYSKGNFLLDIGAGTGHFLNHALYSGFDVQGLEPDSDAIRFAKDVFHLDIDPLSMLHDIPANSKDIITMWHVLEHVYDLQKDFKQFVNILKKNGLFIIAVPNLQSFDANYYKSYWAAYDVPRHLYHFRQEDIEALAKQHGLTLETVKPMKFDSFYVSMLSEKYKKGSLLKAFWIGLKSNMKHKKGGYSSQIYILRK